MGTLKITGTIMLNQFWPLGKSDADTIKINLSIDPHSFLYKHDNIEFQATSIFLNSRVKGIAAPINVIKYRNKTHPSITVRLQGIDAPELHYKLYGRIEKKKLSNEEYIRLKELNAHNEFRQYFAETATYNLLQFLKSKGNNSDIACTFISENINKPSDICDAYGRFVGDIFIENESININHWLLKEGWVFPSFYDSLLDQEINFLLTCYRTGQLLSEHTLQYYSPEIKIFDFGMQFRDPKGKPIFNSELDKGKVILPKFFRRWSIYNLYQKAGINLGTFKQYLESKKDDRVLLRANLNNYRHNQYNALPLSEFLVDNMVTESPDNMIFIEKPSCLIDENGNEILSF